MIVLFTRLAFKNLWRHTRRSLLTMASIACGCAVIIWMQAIIQGRNQNMIDVITSTYTGYIQIYHPDYLKTKLANKYIQASQFDESIMPLLKDFDWTVRQHLPSLISSGEDSVPVQLEGIDPEREATITSLKKKLIKGEFLTDQTVCDKKEVFIGQSLAEVLKVDLGDKLVLLTNASDGTLGNDLFRVQGIFASGSPEFDKGMAFTHVKCSQDLSGFSGIHEVVLKPKNLEDVDGIREALITKLPKFKVSSWREAIPAVDTMIRYNDAMLKMITFILFTVITMGLINTILMNLFERTKEFGVILSIGMTPKELQLLIFLESLFLGIFGVIMGTTLGAAVILYHQWTGFDMSPFFGNGTGTDGFTFDLVIKPIFIFIPYLKIVALELCFLVIAGLYPAWKVSRVNPIEVLRS